MLAQVQSSSSLKKKHGETVSVMKRGASSSWDVTPHWDVAPEEMEVDDEGSVQLALGQEFVHELLEVYFRGVMKARKVSVGPVPTQTRRSARHGEGGRRLLHNGNPAAESRRP